jgi:hypothetical protein
VGFFGPTLDYILKAAARPRITRTTAGYRIIAGRNPRKLLSSSYLDVWYGIISAHEAILPLKAGVYPKWESEAVLREGCEGRMRRKTHKAAFTRATEEALGQTGATSTLPI